MSTHWVVSLVSNVGFIHIGWTWLMWKQLPQNHWIMRRQSQFNSYKKKIMTWCCNLWFSWVNSSGYKSLTMCWTKLPGPLVEWYLFSSWLCGILFCSGRCKKWLTDGWLLTGGVWNVNILAGLKVGVDGTVSWIGSCCTGVIMSAGPWVIGVLVCVEELARLAVMLHGFFHVGEFADVRPQSAVSCSSRPSLG